MNMPHNYTTKQLLKDLEEIKQNLIVLNAQTQILTDKDYKTAMNLNKRIKALIDELPAEI